MVRGTQAPHSAHPGIQAREPGRGGGRLQAAVPSKGGLGALSLDRERKREMRAVRETRKEVRGVERADRLPSAPQTLPYLFGDVAILVNVVEVKGPLELLMDCSSQQDGETNHEVLWRKGGGFYFQFAVWLPLKCTSVWVRRLRHRPGGGAHQVSTVSVSVCVVGMARWLVLFVSNKRHSNVRLLGFFFFVKL